MTTINFYGETINLKPKVSCYVNDRMAITFSDKDTGEPFGCLTVNIDEEQLKEDEIFVKTWSENEPWVPQIVRTF